MRTNQIKFVLCSTSRQGSVIVIFVLKFKQGVTKEYAISVLKHAAERGNLGPLKVNGSSIAATERYDFERTSTTTRPTPGNPQVGVSRYISDKRGSVKKKKTFLGFESSKSSSCHSLALFFKINTLILDWLYVISTML